MQKLKIGFLALAIVALAAFKSDKPAYRLYSKDGKSVKFKKMVDALQDADIVFFGELHNNPIAHWLQLEITKELFVAKTKNLVLGAEMFETDNQLLIDEYFNGDIKQSSFESEARLWPNYKTDYKPLLELAKDSGLRFIATNIPRRYASLVNKKGFEGLDSLSTRAREYIAHLPIQYDGELSAYKNILEMMKDMPHVNPNIPKAQAIKDATMAEFILKNWSEGQLFLHYNGSYHSDNFQSIIWYLQQAKTDLKIQTISCVEQVNIDSLDSTNINVANFIIAVPENMTKTY
ncbi:MAG: ChaN family lipoprotein [Bacteroidales bacterium]|nr:ChaN family lipoprotein [Bacteroidales bacterium]